MASLTSCSLSKYSLTAIGSERNYCYPTAINSQGQVVGNRGEQAFLWDRMRGLRNVGLMSHTTSSAHGINDAGIVVGGLDYGGLLHASVWQSNGHFTELGTITRYDNVAYDINESGQFIGNYHHADFGYLAWVDTGPGIKRLHSYGQSYATAIYNVGQIAGGATTRTGFHAVIWTIFGELRDLNRRSEYSIGYGINDLGDVVGDAYDIYGHETAHIWLADGREFDLALPYSEATSINNRGEVTGNFNNAAFIWTQQTGVVSLNRLLDESGQGWSLEKAIAINDAGQIVGMGRILGSRYDRAFLLTPHPG